MATTLPPAQLSPSQPSEFRVVWLAFANSAKQFFGPVPEDRALDQFLELRDRTFAIVLDEQFVYGLESNIQQQLSMRTQAPAPRDELIRQVFDALLEEMRASSRAAEVIHAIATAGSAEDASKAKKAQLSRLSTTLGSLNDVLGEVPWLKTGIGLFKELVDFFK